MSCKIVFFLVDIGQELAASINLFCRLLQCLHLELLLLIDQHFLVGLQSHQACKEIGQAHRVEQIVQVQLLVDLLVGLLKQSLTVDSTLVPLFVLAATAKERGHQPGIESLRVSKTKLMHFKLVILLH